MENLTVKQFCEHYEKLTSDDAKDRYVKVIIKRTYAPYMEKLVLCKQMAEKSVRITEQGASYLDMNANKLNFVGVIICLYTTLLFDKNNEGKPDVTGCYDALVKNKIVDVLLEKIGEDIDELLTVNKSCLDNVYAEYCSSEAYWGRQLEKLGAFSGVIEGLITNLIKQTVTEE